MDVRERVRTCVRAAPSCILSSCGKSRWPYAPSVRSERTSSQIRSLGQHQLLARVLAEKAREPLQQKLVQTWGQP
jgi:hypothetical protein